MSAVKKTRIKAPAKTFSVPQTKDECAEAINTVGRLQRRIINLQAAMNDEIAEITDRFTGQFTPLQEELKALSDGVQAFCDANRDDLTNNHKTKSGEFITGLVQWRQRPPSVQVRGADTVIETLKRLLLDRFIRVKEEINKEAILNEPDAIAGIAGIAVKKGVEDFVITPFEQDAS